MHLNLARKWRSKQFDELVGQNLIVRIIKNSLFKNQLFPVYLFAGPRGCGKTSLARLFAAALNCDRLSAFQNNPQEVKLPCLNCTSCLSMQNFNHPDFIEIDAASHTGVDDMRYLVENASFVPVMGQKKVYLIDEVHMLSKAAFNALLKIFEEPPKSVIFMLATTDPHKIIDTVKSRAFQLFFDPITPDEMVKHLKLLCDEENLAYNSDGLYLIAHQTAGSMRDAINLIERIRLIYPEITKKSVYTVLGYIDDNQILEIFRSAVNKSPKEILDLCVALNLEKYNSVDIWRKIVEFIRLALYIKYGVQVSDYLNLTDSIKSITENYSDQDLISMLDVSHSYELLFTKSSNAYQILEIFLLKLSSEYKEKKKLKNSDNNTNYIAKIATQSRPEIKEINDSWKIFLEEIDALNDKLIVSVLKQAQSNIDQVKSKILLKFSQDMIFFKDLIDNSRNQWFPILQKIFGEQIELACEFSEEKKPVLKPNLNVIQETKSEPKVIKTFPVKQKIEFTESVDIQNLQKANMLLKFFPGTVTSVSENNKI